MNRSLFLLFVFCTAIISLAKVEKKSHWEEKLMYSANNGWIESYNLERYNNRPLYIDNGKGIIIAGDKPLVRLALKEKLLGNLVLWFERGKEIKKIYDFDRIKSSYSAGQMKWEIGDSRFDGVSFTFEVLPAASGTGMVIRLETKGLKLGDKLNWSFGGGKKFPKRNVNFEFDLMGHPEMMDWKDTGSNTEVPLFHGEFNWEKGDIHALSFNLDSDGAIVCNSAEQANIDFLKARHRLDETVGRIKIDTPDSYLNAIAKASVFAVDGTWYPPAFVHGCMLWNSALPGWRTTFGGTVFGWHDRVLDEAKYYIESQVRESDKTQPKADPAVLMTLQHADSRLFGVGRILKNQKRYNMQSQLFDQFIEDYRWTSDPELIKVLRGALELHLIWLEECFDPDGDGIYESYLNSWPTDSQWYNGGGTAEETSYAYKAHCAARDMARDAGDKQGEKHHNEMLKKIRKGFFDKLWISGKGHSGAYREQGGNERLHENPWLYSIFLPIDAGLTSQSQAIESVYYSQTALQNDAMPSGGRQVWSSNWVPGIWSVRERWPGDNYHLALSYFQAGLPEDAWDIMKGTYMHTAFNHLVPGNFGGKQGGTDFGECVHMFSRTLVSGLFGFNPDYPNGKVTIAPNFPKGWQHASIELPDVKIDFKRNKLTSSYSFNIRKKADMILKMPVQTRKVKNVILNGKKIKWETEPGVGCTMVIVKSKNSDKADIRIEQADSLPYFPPVFIEGNVDEDILLVTDKAKIISFYDPQKVTANQKIHDGEMTVRIADNKGFHTVIAETMTGENPQFRVFRIKVNDPEGDAAEAARHLAAVPGNATWKTVDVTSFHNADIKAIYQQKYLSPRPNTVSARLGTDGYSPWTFPIWKSKAPDIKTDNVQNLIKKGNILETPQGVPFTWNDGENNIAFTSMWDNYPTLIEFPVNCTGEVAYFLVAGSTNVMQCEIANAVIRLNYADGTKDSLELIPPLNYWNLCPIQYKTTSPEQGSRNDYTSEIDRFAMPEVLPETVNLGENCRAMLLNLKLRKNVPLESVVLETLSQEVVVGIIGITIMN